MRVGTHSTSGTEPNKESTCDNVKKKNACGREAPKVHATPKQMKTAHAATKQRQHLRQRINKHTCGNESRTVLVATEQIKIPHAATKQRKHQRCQQQTRTTPAATKRPKKTPAATKQPQLMRQRNTWGGGGKRRVRK